MAVRLGIGLILLVTVGGVSGACGGSEDTPLTSLRTAFEQRNGSSWTSLREEALFLRQLDAASDRVRVSEIGRSVKGRPLRLVTVGASRPRAAIAAESSLLFVCTQHGTEPAGREACLQSARDAVEDLGSSTLLIIPTANPDGLATGDRENANGVDVNRDHMALATPEASAIAAVVRDYKPDLVGDFHEYKDVGASRVLLSNPTTLHLNVDPRIRRLSSELNRYSVRELDKARLETGLYPSRSPEVDESVLRQQVALRHSPSLLVETPRRGILSPLKRVTAHDAAARALLRMLREQTGRLAASTAEARRAAAAEGASGEARYYYRSPTRYSERPPCGYKLMEDEYRRVNAELRLHGVTATRAGKSWFASTAQASQPRIGLLLDARAPRELTDAEPLPC